MITERLWVFDQGGELTGGMQQRDVEYVPGLYKIFDEILVNAADNKQRDPNMDSIDVTIDVAEGVISEKNNGNAVPVKMHAEEKVYVPELIFGHLLTGSNFSDSDKKTTGGRNGYGAKLANIFSVRWSLAARILSNQRNEVSCQNRRAVNQPLLTCRLSASCRRSSLLRLTTAKTASSTLRRSLTI